MVNLRGCVAGVGSVGEIKGDDDDAVVVVGELDSAVVVGSDCIDSASCLRSISFSRLRSA